MSSRQVLLQDYIIYIGSIKMKVPTLSVISPLRYAPFVIPSGFLDSLVDYCCECNFGRKEDRVLGEYRCVNCMVENLIRDIDRIIRLEEVK